MHPLIILIPVASLTLAPRWWAKRVLKQHHQGEACADSAGQLARHWLDRNRLQAVAVAVEVTDLGDHYDPESKMVRLSRDYHGRKTLTAVTTAAHEVAHALQDAEAYAPFVWRNRSAQFAATAGRGGTVILLSVPLAALLGRRPMPPMLVSSTLWLMLGSGVAAQLSALLSELNASFVRALPLLRDAGIDGAEFDRAKRILLACSLTYAAASLLSVLHFWPWLGRWRPYAISPTPYPIDAPGPRRQRPAGGSPRRPAPGSGSAKGPRPRGSEHALLRRFGKPVIRAWLRLLRPPRPAGTRSR